MDFHRKPFDRRIQVVQVLGVDESSTRAHASRLSHNSIDQFRLSFEVVELTPFRQGPRARQVVTDNNEQARRAKYCSDSKLELELAQTANAALKFLKVLKSGLSKYDHSRGHFFLNTSKRFIKYEIQEVKKNASDLRYLATRIRRTKQPSGSEINAARMCMNQTAEAMIDLIRAARVYDHNYASRTTPVDDDSGSMKMETKLFGRTHHYENSKSMEDLFRSSSSEFKVRVTEESAKTPDTVEAVVRLTLRSSFGGLNALRSQIATTEKALAASLA